MIYKLNNIKFEKSVKDVMKIRKNYLIKSIIKIMEIFQKKEKFLSLILTNNQKEKWTFYNYKKIIKLNLNKLEINNNKFLYIFLNWKWW